MEEVKILGSSITDWIQAIAGLIAVPGAIAGFILLFRKDKEKETQINKLAGIVEKIEAQNEIMKEANSLSAQQVDILRNSLILNKQDDGASKRLLEIEEKKLKLSVKPLLIVDGGSSGPYSIGIRLLNIGERAHIQSIRLVSGNIYIQPISIPYRFEKQEQLHISASSNSALGRDAMYEIEFIYEDELKNKYKAVLIGRGAEGKFSEQIEITE